jgi:8-oxo-dGTP pyrophosphatase MutT (NUDIX family)
MISIPSDYTRGMPMSDYMRGLRAKLGPDVVVAPSASVLVFDEHGRVLVGRHAEGGGRWVIPGGGVEPDEQPADAAVREAWEETGLHVEPTRLLGVYGGPEGRVTYRNGDQVSYLMVVFEGRVLAGDPRPDGVEILELRWVAPPELTALPMAPWMRRLLGDALAERGRAHFAPATWTPPGLDTENPHR